MVVERGEVANDGSDEADAAGAFGEGRPLRECPEDLGDEGVHAFDGRRGESAGKEENDFAPLWFVEGCAVQQDLLEAIHRYEQQRGSYHAFLAAFDLTDPVVERAEARLTDRADADLLPMGVWDVILAEKADRSWADVSAVTGRPRNHNWHVKSRRPSLRIVGELAAALDSQVLLALSNSGVIWDPIISIADAGQQRTFDLEVPGYENFVANDVVVHNSTLAANIATNVAMNDRSVAIFSLEMSREEVVQRLLCSVGRVDSMKLRTGQLGPQLWQKVVHAASRMYKAPIFIDDSGQLTVTDIRAKCRRLKRQHGLDLVIIDYLQLMTGSARENRQQEIAEISRSLKNLARELDLPIMAVSQLNRSLEAREDKRPRLGDLRESGALEQDSDVVMFIYRHEYYHPEAQDTKGLAEVIVAKHRAGSTGKVDMTFLPEFTLFADLGRDVSV